MRNIFDRLNTMKNYDLIRAMVKSLEKPWVDNVDMDTFGMISDGICYGCAATNTLCELADERFYLRSQIEDSSSRAAYLGVSNSRLRAFEEAIDSLRRGVGQTLRYNDSISNAGFKHLTIDPALVAHWGEEHQTVLPCITSDYHEDWEILHRYKSLADYLELHEKVQDFVYAKNQGCPNSCECTDITLLRVVRVGDVRYQLHTQCSECLWKQTSTLKIEVLEKYWNTGE